MAVPLATWPLGKLISSSRWICRARMFRPHAKQIRTVKPFSPTLTSARLPFVTLSSRSASRGPARTTPLVTMVIPAPMRPSVLKGRVTVARTSSVLTAISAPTTVAILRLVASSPITRLLVMMATCAPLGMYALPVSALASPVNALARAISIARSWVMIFVATTKWIVSTDFVLSPVR
jgi:hypothetical protein